MSQDPFGAKEALMQLAFAVLFISFCLHWAAILLAQVWPWLMGLCLMACLGAIAWRLFAWRRDRW